MISKNEFETEILINLVMFILRGINILCNFFPIYKLGKDKQMIDYFHIKEKKELISELSMIFQSKKYEMDLKSIIYFFESLNVPKIENDKWIKNILDKKNLSEMDLNDLKKNLEDLKKEGIYDYENKNNYLKLFTSLYEKKEAIDFLLSKRNQDLRAIYDKIDPSNRIITIKDIQDTEECIKIFNIFESKENYKIPTIFIVISFYPQILKKSFSHSNLKFIQIASH